MPATWSDPLYRPVTELTPGCERRTFAGVEVGVTVTDTDPGALEAMWNPDRSVTLSLADSVTPAELAAVLPGFLAHASTLADGPTEATLALPSRDVDRAAIARAAGLLPQSILAIADLRRPQRGDTAGAPFDLRIRQARPDDAPAFAELWWEQTAFEARVGTLRATPAIRAAVDVAAPGQVSDRALTLVAAGPDGRLVAAVHAQPVAESAWAGARTVLEPVSYLAMASTSATSRGSGAGGALAAEVHRRQRAAGAQASLLHYGVHNPLSVPFWSQQGYRPLMTYFNRPAGWM